MLSSRLRSYRLAFSMASAAWTESILDELLVGLVEVVGADLVGEVERAHDPAGGDDRHAEERAHLRVRRGPPAAEARVAAHVVRAIGHRRGQHGAEQPVLARQGTHGGDELVAHARGDELREAALAVGHADRRVLRVDEPARGVREALQHRLDRRLGGDRQDRVVHGAQGRALLLHRAIEDTPGQAALRSASSSSTVRSQL
jgi:hypothetical protein